MRRRRMADRLNSLRKFRQHRSLRRARYPWNALVHELRWMATDRQAIAAWTDHRLQLGPHHWVFIAGCNNSGTTLLRKVLARHPSIRSLPREGQALTRALPVPSALGLPRLFTKRLDVFRWTEEHDPLLALRAKYDWARYFDRRPGNLLVKSPENTVRTRWLQRNFEPSRFLHMVRSPYAVCEGIRRRSGHSLEEAAEHWREVNRCLLADMPFLQHLLLLRYEEFCASPERDLARIESFLRLEAPFPPDTLAPLEVQNLDGKASPIRSFNDRSLARLDRAEIDLITRIAGTVMEQLGYEAPDDSRLATVSPDGPSTSAGGPLLPISRGIPPIGRSTGHAPGN